LVHRAADLAELAGSVRLSGLAQLELGMMEISGGALAHSLESLRAAADHLEKSGDIVGLARAAEALVPLELVFGSLGEAERAARAWRAGLVSDPRRGAGAEAWSDVIRWVRGSGQDASGPERSGAGEGIASLWLGFFRSEGPGRYSAASALGDAVFEAIRPPPDRPSVRRFDALVAPIAALDVAEWTWGLAPGAAALADQLETSIVASRRGRGPRSWERAPVEAIAAIEALRRGDHEAAERSALESVSAAGSAGSALLRGRAVRVLAAVKLATGDARAAVEAARASQRSHRSCGALGEAWIGAMVEVEALLSAGEKGEADRVAGKVPKERRSVPATVCGLGEVRGGASRVGRSMSRAARNSPVKD
jgi:hypothetical protein